MHLPSVRAPACAILAVRKRSEVLRPARTRRSNHGHESRTGADGHPEGLPETVQRPVCRRMSGHVVMENAAAANLHHEEDKQHLESDRDCNQEITGHDPSGMILDEGPPVLRRGSSTSNTARWLGPILAHGARRNIDAQL